MAEFLNTDPRGGSSGTYKGGKPTGKDLGYAQKGAFKTPRSGQKPLTFNQASQPDTNKGRAGYSRMTQDEREKYKVAHGIAPTAADPSAGGVAEREEAKIAKSRGLLSKKEIRAKKIVKTREIDEAKYYSDIKASQAARMKAAGISDRKTRKAKQNAMPNAWGKLSGGRTADSRSSRGGGGVSSIAKASSNFGFSGNTGTLNFGALGSSYGQI